MYIHSSGSTMRLSIALIVCGICCSQLAHGKFYDVGTSYEITMRVFSGRKDHSWAIDSKHAKYQQIAQAINSCSPSSMYEGLGYSGFTVTAKNALGQQAFKTIGRGKARDLEMMLLQSFPGKMSKAVEREVNDGINDIGEVIQTIIPGKAVQQTVHYSIVVRKEDRKRRKRQAAGGAYCRGTIFNPRNWNYRPVQRRNNCYNYATNIITNTFAQPGRATGQRHSAFTAENVYSACLRDGLVPIREVSPSRIPRAPGYCVIALVIWPGEDFHFLRMDLNGYWSQKNGRGPARNYDDSRRPISDPRYANRGPYRVFAGFLGVHPNIRIR